MGKNWAFDEHYIDDVSHAVIDGEVYVYGFHHMEGWLIEGVENPGRWARFRTENEMIDFLKVQNAQLDPVPERQQPQASTRAAVRKDTDPDMDR